MGQKVNPHGLRVGIIKDWDSKWYADKKDFGDLLVEDNEIRKYIKKTVVINEDGKQCVKTNLNFRKTADGMVIYISALNRHAI